MKLHLPGCRNKLMTKLLKLTRYQKHSRTFFLLSSRIESGFWRLMASPGYIYASFRHIDLSRLINNSSESSNSPLILPRSAYSLLKFLWQRSKTKSAHELIQNDGGVHEKCWRSITPCCFPPSSTQSIWNISLWSSLFRSKALWKWWTTAMTHEDTNIWVLDKKGSIQPSGWNRGKNFLHA